MQKQCVQCSVKFQITEKDLEFYDKVSPMFKGKIQTIPPASLCPKCRQQRRMVWRNEKSLYKRICNGTGKNIVAAYPQDSKYTVYHTDYWWSDDFNGLEYGMEYDPSRSFFEQFEELLTKVPRLSLSNSNNENCEYVNYTNYSKDCYLIYGNHQSEKCCYCWRVHHCLECFDCAQLLQCSYCYDCIDCNDCYELLHSQSCENCSNSRNLLSCHSCKDCAFCVNLINAQYCILNKKYSKEEYTIKMKEIIENSDTTLKEFSTLQHSVPQRALHMTQCEYCTGDYLIKCKDCSDLYSASGCQDCHRIYLAEDAKDCRDCDIVGWPGELCYEGISNGVHARMNAFCPLCWSCTDTYYSESCFHSNNLFGCVGLKKNSYCILNIQYSKEEYESIALQIIENMKISKEYGEFFPIELSPFAYNETMAFDNYPLQKKEVEKNGWKWREISDALQEVKKTIQADALPVTIETVPDDILNWAIECSETKRPFKIVKMELDFYRKMNLPIPRLHPDERHKLRMSKRNPRTLYNRACANCSKDIQTTYSPDRPEKVYCEECYLGEVY